MTPASRSNGRTVLIVAFFSAAVGAAIAVRMTRSRHTAPFVPGPDLVPMAILLASWLVLSAYWEFAARNTSAAVSSESKASRALHLALISPAQLLTFWPYSGWPAAHLHGFEFPRVLPALPWLAPLGVSLGLFGLVLSIWSRRELGRQWSGAVTAKVDHELIRSGPYRRIRHPIYTGVIAMYLGPALVAGRWQGLIALALVAIAYARKIGMEERNLREVFGAQFDAYREDSWALVPWVL